MKALYSYALQKALVLKNSKNVGCNVFCRSTNSKLGLSLCLSTAKKDDRRQDKTKNPRQGNLDKVSLHTENVLLDSKGFWTKHTNAISSFVLCEFICCKNSEILFIDFGSFTFSFPPSCPFGNLHTNSGEEFQIPKFKIIKNFVS